MKLDASAVRHVGQDLVRPEGLLADRAGNVYTADLRGHVNIIAPDGSQRALGAIGGRPNGLAMDREGAIVVANIGSGELQRLTPDGRHTVLDRRPAPNFPLVDRRGRVWCSSSTERADTKEALREARPDGSVFRLDGGSSEVVARHLVFANGLALDAQEQYLYVAETLPCRITRFRITATGACAEPEPYGPHLGERGQPDGIAFDSAGNLWVTLVWDDAIGVIYPDQSFEVVLRDSDLLKHPSNLCFGGPDLATICVGSLEGTTVPAFPAPHPGLPLVHQQPRPC